MSGILFLLQNNNIFFKQYDVNRIRIKIVNYKKYKEAYNKYDCADIDTKCVAVEKMFVANCKEGCKRRICRYFNFKRIETCKILWDRKTKEDLWGCMLFHGRN